MALASRSCLTELNLENNTNIFSKDVEICNALDGHTNLRTLNLASNQMSPPAIDALIRVLKQTNFTNFNQFS